MAKIVGFGTRRQWLSLCAGAAVTPCLAQSRPIVHFGFDGTLANDGVWGGELRAAPDTLIANKGIAELSGNGKPVFEDARLGAVDSFTAAVSFNPVRLNRELIVLGRPGHWQIRVNSSNLLSLQSYYQTSRTQMNAVTLLSEPDTWYQIAISFDRSRQRLEFALRQVGSDSLESGGFRLLPAVFGPLTNGANKIEVGAQFQGYMDHVAIYDRSMTQAELRELLDRSLPSMIRSETAPFESFLFPVVRDKVAMLPARSDVALSSRWWHPQKRSDPHDTLRDMWAFGATRLEWIYDNDPAHISQVKAAGISFTATINGTDDQEGRPYSARNFDDALISFPWMISWTHRDGLPPGAACVNNPKFRARLTGIVETVTRAGASGVQYDDWASNVQIGGSNGDCFCEYCLRGFRGFLSKTYKPAELESWGVGNPADFDYRTFLKSKHGLTNVAEYQNYRRQKSSDPLQQAYVRFQAASVRAGMAALKSTLAANAGPDGRRPTLSINTNFTTTSQQGNPFLAADLPDYFMGEGSDETIAGVFVNAKIVEALHRVSVFSPFPYKLDKTRAVIALQYALGQLCLAPYDVWMHTSDLPRHFGNPADYSDIFGFVRTQQLLFDSMETIAVLGIAVDTEEAEDKRFRPLVQSLAEANIPFVILPLGRLHFEPRIDPRWADRLTTVINLTASTDLKRRFRNARIYPGGMDAVQLRAVSLLSVESPNVIATLRGTRDSFGKTVVVHLVNRNFDEFSKSVPLEQFGVRLQQRGFWGKVGTAELLAPGAAPLTLPVKAFGRELRIVVPELQTWAVLKFKL